MRLTKSDFSRLRFSCTIGEEYVYFCPQCGSADRRGHLFWNRQSGAYYCYKCHLKGYTTRKTDVKKIPLISAESLTEITIPNDFMPIWQIDEYQRSFHLYLQRFLCSKDLDDNTIYARRLYFSCIRQAILIPVIVGGVAVAAQIRNLNTAGGRPKYYPLKDTHPSRYLYNWDNAINYSTVVVTEGPFDVMKTGDHSLALFGTSITKYQVAWFQQLPAKGIIIFLDNNASMSAYDIAGTLIQFFSNVRIAMTPILGNSGPGNLPEGEILEALFKARKPSLAQSLKTHWENTPIKLLGV